MAAQFTTSSTIAGILPARLAAMFRDNFTTYADQVRAAVRAAGPRI